MKVEYKFSPSPKSIANPRLFYARNDGIGCQFFNIRQTAHTSRTFHK